MFPSSNHARRGVFFSFEGIDGSGKSTQARLLAESLLSLGEPVVVVREPGGTRLGEHVRTLLLDTDADVSQRAELFLFLAARSQVVSSVIEPALLAGTHVVADRYVDSTLAYQGAGRRLADSVPLDALNAVATGGLLPDRTYLIDIATGEGSRRRATRESDRMEQVDEAFMARARGAYRLIAAAQPQRVSTLDGRMAAASLHRLIRLDALDLIACAARA